MTSEYARNGHLSRLMLDAWSQCRDSPSSVDAKLQFYFRYLYDVVPLGICVQRVPSEPNTDQHSTAHREEIQLLTLSGRLFMSGLISRERVPTSIETVAANEAYGSWLEEDFVPGDSDWRFFTGLISLRFYKGHHGDEYDVVETLSPMLYPREVAAYLQEEFDNLRWH